MTRKPCVIGQFYPADPRQLRSFLDDAIPRAPAPIPACGVIAPHAGYMYSGRVAGKAFGRVEVPDAVVLLGPNHTGLGAKASIVSRGAWSTPLGVVPIHEGLADAIKNACPLLEEDAVAHAQEHSLEVEIPFLQHRNPNVKIVPITFMFRGRTEIAEAGRQIAEAVASWPEPVLLVASTDMTHYEAHETAKDKDSRAIARVLTLDAPGLLDTVARQKISMCGVVPAAVLLTAARHLGATRGELVSYTTSGETSGDYEHVVGYAGMVIL